jgi:hypothetical protein
MSEIDRTIDLISWFEKERGGNNISLQRSIEGHLTVLTVRSMFSPCSNSFKMKQRVLKAWISPTGNIVRVSASFPKEAAQMLGEMLSLEVNGQLQDFNSDHGRAVLKLLCWNGRRITTKGYLGMISRDT